jgi:hypothetical protein
MEFFMAIGANDEQAPLPAKPKKVSFFLRRSLWAVI